MRSRLLRSLFQQLMVAVDFCHAMGIALTAVRPENMMLVEPNDAPSLCSMSSPNAEGYVTPVGGLGRRGVPRLKLCAFRLGSSGCEGRHCDAYTAPEVRRTTLVYVFIHKFLRKPAFATVFAGHFQTCPPSLHDCREGQPVKQSVSNGLSEAQRFRLHAWC